jgi:hypothetical protein
MWQMVLSKYLLNEWPGDLNLEVVVVEILVSSG